MPASLRFVAILLGLGVVAALASAVVRYRQAETQAQAAAEAMTGGRVERGRSAIARLGCGSCHIVPGVADAKGEVGPSLRGVARRSIVAGRLSNTPEHLVLWIRYPQHVAPGSAMPEQAVSDRDARDIAAYLLTLRR